MRVAERRRVEAQISQLAGFPVGVGWLSHYHDKTCWALADAEDREIFIVQKRWDKGTPDSRADTVAHEVAHLTSGCIDHEADWAREFARLLPLAEALVW